MTFVRKKKKNRTGWRGIETHWCTSSLGFSWDLTEKSIITPALSFRWQMTWDEIAFQIYTTYFKHIFPHVTSKTSVCTKHFFKSDSLLKASLTRDILRASGSTNIYKAALIWQPKQVKCSTMSQHVSMPRLLKLFPLLPDQRSWHDPGKQRPGPAWGERGEIERT